MTTMLGGHSTLMIVSSGERWICSMPPTFGSPIVLITSAGFLTARATTSRTLREGRSPARAARQSAMNWSLSNIVPSPSRWCGSLRLHEPHCPINFLEKRRGEVAGALGAVMQDSVDIARVLHQPLHLR